MGSEYSIKTQEDLIPFDEDDNNSTCLGYADYFNQTIVLCNKEKSAKSNDLFEVFLHEMLHVLCSSMRMDYLNSADGHEDIYRLAILISDTLIRNKLINLEKFDETK